LSDCRRSSRYAALGARASTSHAYEQAAQDVLARAPSAA